MSSIVDKWKAFIEWQQRPSRVPTMTEEHHRCHTCGQEYQGNYCPCCGQSARIGRYSFKKAFLLVAFNLIVMSGFNLAGKSNDDEEAKVVVLSVNRGSVAEERSKKVLTKDERYDEEYRHFVDKFMELQDNKPAIFM